MHIYQFAYFFVLLGIFLGIGFTLQSYLEKINDNIAQTNKTLTEMHMTLGVVACRSVYPNDEHNFLVCLSSDDFNIAE